MLLANLKHSLLKNGSDEPIKKEPSLFKRALFYTHIVYLSYLLTIHDPLESQLLQVLDGPEAVVNILSNFF